MKNDYHHIDKTSDQHQDHHKKSSYKNFILSQHYYFTNWVLILIILHHYTHKIFNILFLSFFVFFASTYLFYYNPACLPMSKDNEMVGIKNHKKHLIHIVFHILPFLFVVYKYFKIFTQRDTIADFRLRNALFFLMFYAFLINFPDLYLLEWNDFVNILLIVFIPYSLIIIFILMS